MEYLEANNVRSRQCVIRSEISTLDGIVAVAPANGEDITVFEGVTVKGEPFQFRIRGEEEGAYELYMADKNDPDYPKIFGTDISQLVRQGMWKLTSGGKSEFHAQDVDPDTGDPLAEFHFSGDEQGVGSFKITSLYGGLA